MAYILNMHSYSNYYINMYAGLARLPLHFVQNRALLCGSAGLLKGRPHAGVHVACTRSGDEGLTSVLYRPFVTCNQHYMFTDESRPRAGFIPAETLVHNGTAGDSDTAGGTLTQIVR